MNQILKKLDLTNRQIKLYMELNFHGASTSRELATLCGIPRQTAYSLLLGFVETGLAVQTKMKGVKHFYTDRHILYKYLDSERDRMIRLKRELNGGRESVVERAVPLSGKLPTVQFYDGTLGQQRLLESILDFYKKDKSKMFRGYGINYFSHAKGLENYFQYFIKKRGSYGVKTNLFIARGPDGFNIKDEKSAHGRTVKRLNVDEQMAGIYMVGNRVYMFSYQDNVGLMIENQAIVSFLKSAFDDHWERVSFVEKNQ